MNYVFENGIIIYFGIFDKQGMIQLPQNKETKIDPPSSQTGAEGVKQQSN